MLFSSQSTYADSKIAFRLLCGLKIIYLFTFVVFFHLLQWVFKPRVTLLSLKSIIHSCLIERCFGLVVFSASAIIHRLCTKRQPLKHTPCVCTVHTQPQKIISWAARFITISNQRRKKPYLGRELNWKTAKGKRGFKWIIASFSSCQK